MKLSDLGRRAGEMLRAMGHSFSRNAAGIMVPGGIAAGGVFTAFAEGVPAALGRNLVVQAARDDVLNVYFRGAAASANFYIAPFANNIAPVGTLTPANFNATQDEFTNYTEATRRQWVTNGASTAQKLSNSNSLAEFTFGTGGGTVYGAALFTVATKEATTGLLISAALFDAPVTLNAGGKLQIQYEFECNDATPP